MTYYYDRKTQHLYTDEEYKRPFLCPVEVTPLEFNDPQACHEFLEEQGIVDASISYKLFTD